MLFVRFTFRCNLSLRDVTFLGRAAKPQKIQYLGEPDRASSIYTKIHFSSKIILKNCHLQKTCYNPMCIWPAAKRSKAFSIETSQNKSAMQRKFGLSVCQLARLTVQSLSNHVFCALFNLR
jgi:hypothetical protein